MLSTAKAAVSWWRSNRFFTSRREPELDGWQMRRVARGGRYDSTTRAYDVDGSVIVTDSEAKRSIWPSGHAASRSGTPNDKGTGNGGLWVAKSDQGMTAGGKLRAKKAMPPNVNPAARWNGANFRAPRQRLIDYLNDDRSNSRSF
jgi:hypothetical protein